jgi:hypothetical protein
MEGEEAQDFKRILRSNEEIVHAINSVILVLTTKVVELEQGNISNSVLSFRGWTNSLEAKCDRF